MTGISAIGLSGLQSGFARLRSAASDIARVNGGGSDQVSLVNSLIEAKGAQRQVEASTRVIQVGDRLLGNLLDKLA